MHPRARPRDEQFELHQTWARDSQLNFQDSSKVKQSINILFILKLRCSIKYFDLILLGRNPKAE